MLTKDEYRDLLDQRGTLIIDGALATELEARGLDLSHPLWSGKTLKEHPEAIRRIHYDYFAAGADIAITASYQASVEGFLQHLQLHEEEAEGLVKTSVLLAQEARDDAYDDGIPADRQLLVAGSVGPYGAYLADGSEYRGDYKISRGKLESFHRPRIRALIDAGVDLLALETMPNFDEIKVILDLLAVEFPAALSWVSCTIKDATHLSDGTCFHDVLAAVSQHSERVVAFGINCVRPDLVSECLRHLKSLSNIPLLCYPNSGEIYTSSTHCWSDRPVGAPPALEHISEWRSAGANLIGGCCRTTPKDIRHLASALANHSHLLGQKVSQPSRCAKLGFIFDYESNESIKEILGDSEYGQ